MNTVEQVMAKGQEDVATYIQTLTATEALWLAGSTSHALTGLSANPLVNAIQFRVTVALYSELSRQLIKRAVEAGGDERPGRHVVDGWNALTSRVFTELNEAVVRKGGL